MKLVTGGAGFIGSHLTEKLSEKYDLKVVDNLSSGSRENIPEDVIFIEKDIREITEDDLENVDTVFHFAANADTRTFPDDRDSDFDTNVVGMKNLLDICADAGVEDFVFASSSVVYGENAEIPTSETHKLEPVSMYGATKVSGEDMARVYAERFNIGLTILRYANIVGGRNRKGVIYDFVKKLENNPDRLEILGDGRQKKSYMHISDAIRATMTAWKSDETVFNIGSKDSTSVTRIADIVSEELDLDPEYSYTGGSQGWEGDIPEMRLSIDQLENEGFTPANSSDESVRKTVREIK